MTAARTLFSHMLVFLLLRNTWACSDFGSVAPMVLVSQTVSARVERSWLAQEALRTNFTHGILPMTRAGLPLEHAGRVTLRSHGPYDSSDSPARIRGIFSGVEFLRRAPQVSLCACECDIHHGNDMRPVRPRRRPITPPRACPHPRSRSPRWLRCTTSTRAALLGSSWATRPMARAT